MRAISRRQMLSRTAALGCSLAASPFVTPVSFASGSGENRLVVIILRGGLDGLDLLRPIGDPDYTALGRQVAPGLPLDGFFEVHPQLNDLMPLWAAGELSFVHATSTPYRDKRSHFDGQDHLEAGFSSPDVGQIRDGWLNRFLQTQSSGHGSYALAVDYGELLLLRGSARSVSWSPDVELRMSPQAAALAQFLMQGDPLFEPNLRSALALSEAEPMAVMASGETGGDTGGEMMDPMMGVQKQEGRAEDVIARFAAEKLREDTRLAAFSINGWDTHNKQDKNLARSLPKLAHSLLTLKAELGPVWQKTTVLCMTEFGRTARFNGTFGTDHGTAGAMILAGGSLARSQVAGSWPGLDEASLYARRDLLPTSDVRAHAAWAMRHGFGLDRSTLESVVFPGLDMGDDIGLFA